MAGVALITGTSTGIGLSAAIFLAKAGFKVVATMRNLDKAAALQARAESEGVEPDVQQLDVQDQLSITACVNSVREKYGRIDVLVNNAGAGFLGSLEQTPEADLQRTMDVNFLGVWRVTQAVFPVMRAQGSGHVITISSIGGLIGAPFNDAYCAAKFAVEGMMESLAPVAQRLGIRISLIEPGPVHTEFVASVRAKFSGVVEDAYQPLLNAYLAGTEQVFKTAGQTSDEIARLIVTAATAEQPAFRYVTSDLVRSFVERKYTDPTGNSVLALTGARLAQ